MIDIPISIDSVNPLNGSYAGGVEITLTGKGFSKESEVYFCDRKAEIFSWTHSEIICTTPKLPTLFS